MCKDDLLYSLNCAVKMCNSRRVVITMTVSALERGHLVGVLFGSRTWKHSRN